MKILVVDDIPENRSILSQFLSRMGHEPIEAENGEEAVLSFEKYLPDLVIMDILMPLMDGFDATRRIKSLSKDRWTPVIMLTALNRADHLVRGLESGGDDFISKPFDFSLLTAKIRVIERALALQFQILEKNAALQAMGARIEEEMVLGKHVLDSLVPVGEGNDSCVESWVQPLDFFGGDLVLQRRSPDGTLVLLHADSKGHGLSAALGLLPATEVFHAMVDRGFGIETILAEINHKLKELMPSGFFIAVTIVSLSPLRGMLSVANCGNPPAVLLDHHGEIVRRFDSKSLPLGILGSDFRPVVEAVHISDLTPDSERHLYLFSDGLAGAIGEEGEVGSDGVIDILVRTPGEGRFDVVREIALRSSPEQRKDDMSLVSLCCRFQPEREIPAAPGLGAGGNPGGWRFSLDLSPSELRRPDLLPRLMEMMGALGVDHRENEALFVVLGEILSNALDHGILGLDSSLKALENGFEHYYALREEKLSALASGSLTVEAVLLEGQDRGLLRLRVQDSGPGFDFRPYAAPLPPVSSAFEARSDRGLLLVRSLCESLTFGGPGNEVVATLRIQLLTIP